MYLLINDKLLKLLHNTIKKSIFSQSPVLAKYSCFSQTTSKLQSKRFEKLTENNTWCGLQWVRGPQADRRLWRKAVQGAGCDRGWQGGCHQVRFPLSRRISRVSPGWSGTTGPLLPTFSQLSHEVSAEDKVWEPNTVQARTHVGHMCRRSVACCMRSLTPAIGFSPGTGKKWCAAEFNFSIISIILAVTG